MTYQELANLLREHEHSGPKTHLTAYITFSSFGPDNEKAYPWEGRTYVISSNNKAFQPNKSGYSIFGSCLDGSDPYIRLDKYMQAEHGGEDGWIVEDCCVVGYLLIECSDCNISEPTLFYAHTDAMDHMLVQLAEKGELDVEQLKTALSDEKELVEDGQYGANRTCAWLAGQDADWHWKIQPVHIYSPLKMVFPEGVVYE